MSKGRATVTKSEQENRSHGRVRRRSAENFIKNIMPRNPHASPQILLVTPVQSPYPLAFLCSSVTLRSVPFLLLHDDAADFEVVRQGVFGVALQPLCRQ